ncbi:hypothetical protein KORDIASMS9_00246 [Kordia sp. SMS9]|uniref:hypothetical protein n=1 Tax=Kordia sp. SMS9 TaxID=2282170 RepID=UPI000E10BB7F|nr:hypothetical protein [Kordia sp. SMS9]AXG68057.1 hypothetical protein KORDIASMS9_00246 [Kordia sp. SMS9]
MLKNILKLEGVNTLTKSTQKSIIGMRGRICCEWCPDGTCLDWTTPGVTCPFSAGC